MIIDNHTDRISIQVGLSGYSFKVHSSEGVSASGWKTADSIFTTSSLQKRYEQVELSVFTHKFALVPKQFHNAAEPSVHLVQTTSVSESDVVECVEVPEFASVLVYSLSIGESLSKVLSEMVLKTDGSKSRPLPEMFYMLGTLNELQEYNKVLASYMDGYLHLAIAQGHSLVLCNAFEATDFTTAQYYIFMVMKRLQLNPEVSTIYFRTPLDQEEEMSLYRYFKNVEKI